VSEGSAKYDAPETALWLMHVILAKKGMRVVALRGTLRFTVANPGEDHTAPAETSMSYKTKS
jgi:hypothetical protein